nr:hypothetical protein BHE74_00000440 [Ipomoea batatas]GMD56644.1 hypothetical protein BHE74_00000440 [Ipomoea batatas]GMD58545.1 hypothetical protein BHE74_00000440 [Ipomoea batatas]
MKSVEGVIEGNEAWSEDTIKYGSEEIRLMAASSQTTFPSKMKLPIWVGSIRDEWRPWAAS